MPKLPVFLTTLALAVAQAAEPAPSPSATPAPAAPAAVALPRVVTEPVLQHWRHDVAAPRLVTLAQQGHALADAATALCDHSNQEKLDTTRARWIDTFLAWRAAQPLPLDPALVLAVEPGPVQLQQVEDAVRRGSDDKPIPADAGPTATGIKALEYLYWGNDLPKAQLGRLAFRRRCLYSAAVAVDLAHTLDAAASRPPATVSDYLARFSTTLNVLRGNRLAQLGSGKSPTVPEFDGWRSQQTKAALAATLATLEDALATPAKDGQTAQEALDRAGRRELAEQLKAALADIHAQLDTLPPDIAAQFTRRPAAAQNLLAALARLQTLLDGPLTAAFAAS